MRCITENSLKMKSCSKGNQCRLRNDGVTWSHGPKCRSTLLMCCFIDSSPSKMIPRSLTMEAQPMTSFLTCSVRSNQMTSIFDEFIFRRKHCCSRSIVDPMSLNHILSYSCVPLAYRWWQCDDSSLDGDESYHLFYIDAKTVFAKRTHRIAAPHIWHCLPVDVQFSQ